MKIIDFSRAPNPRRLRFFVAEKGIDIAFEDVDLDDQSRLEAPYYEACLSGQYPVLELDDGTYLCESIAISRYLERLHPEPALFGRAPLEEARVEMWNRRLELGLFRHTGDYFGHTAPFFKDRVEQIPAFAKSAQSNALNQFGMIDRALSDHPFIAGDAFSVADITAYIAIDLGTPSVYEVGPEFPNIRRWFAQTSARPSAQSV